MNLIPTRPQLFFTKNDTQDPRIGERVRPVDLQNLKSTAQDWVILGYPDDDGIKLNGGRPGAAEAPRVIRQFFYKMTPPLTHEFQIYDIGDLEAVGDLSSRHEYASQITKSLFEKDVKVLSFGGGHDYGFPDTDSFVSVYKSRGQRPVVINFDAHLDVRPTHQGLNSGTPFYRLLEKHGQSFDFIEIGLQPQCNSRHHWNWAKEKGATLISYNDLKKSGPLVKLWDLDIFKKFTSTTPLFISFDIDVLTSSEAGGCSQSWATGLHTQDCIDFLLSLKRHTDCRGLGIYEVSPSLDIDFRTSKTAALLSYYTLFNSEL